MRGYQKRVIYLKNTGSPLFEEAYFVIKGDCATGTPPMPDMVREANRIISENIRNKKRPIYRRLGYFISFIVGGATALALTALFI